MKIQNTTARVNFGAYFKVPYNKDTLMLNPTGLLPSYGIINKEPALTFVGDSMLAGVFNKQIEKIAKAAGGTVDWLKNNAKNYGLKIPEIDTSHLTIVTGFDDIREIEEYAIKHQKGFSKFSFRTFAKVYKSLKFIFNNENKLPGHIISLNLILKDYIPHIKDFNKFMSNKNKIKLHSIEEIALYQKI